MKFRLVAAIAAAALSLTACSGATPEKKSDPASKNNSEKLVEVSPLTGLELPGGRPNRPIMVAKIDNTASANPQYGLNKADLVVEELVEGGLTRLAAFFYTNTPSKIGPVRSARATDIGIATPVNAQLIASGGAPKTNKRVKSAGIKFHSEDAGAKGFSSDPNRGRPYNRLMNLKTLLKGMTAVDIPGAYFTWSAKAAKKSEEPSADASTDASATPAPQPKTATSASVGFSRSSVTKWGFKDGKWSRTNGVAASGTDFKADTMVVLFSKVGDAGYLDPAGNNVPETEFEGGGRAVVFHGDSVIEGTWVKQNLDSTITMLDEAGEPLTLEPGNVWIELVPKGDGKVSYK